VVLIGSFLTVVAYSRAGSIVFWRTVDGHLEAKDEQHWPTSFAAGALTALSIVIVVLAGPINEYTDAAAAQLLDTSAYLEILDAPVVGEDN